MGRIFDSRILRAKRGDYKALEATDTQYEGPGCRRSQNQC